MGIRQPGEEDSPLPSVRVEVGDARLDAPIPESEATNDGRSIGAIMALLVGVLALLGGTLYLLAPESGQAADGTALSPSTSIEPTTSTTSPPTTTTASTGSELVPELGPEASDLGESVFPFDVYDSAEPPGFLLDVTRFGDTWVGVALGEGDIGVSNLVVSSDGLEWEPVDSVPPPGWVMGLGEVDGRLVAAANVAANAGGDEFDFGAPFDARFFETADLVTWQPSSAFAPMSGTGAIFFASIGQEAVGIPTRSEVAEPEFDEVVQFFDEVLQPERARQVCVVDYRTDGGTEVAELSDCDGNLLGELRADDAPRLFAQSGYIERCVLELREAAQFSETLLIQRRRNESASTAAAVTEVDQRLVGLGRMFGETYLSGGYNPGSFSICSISNEEVDSGWALYQATAAAGSNKASGLEGFSSHSRPAQAANGYAFLVGDQDGSGAIAGSRPPYSDWQSGQITSTPNLRSAIWTITPDASLMLGATDRQWTFLTTGGEVVEELAIVGGQDAQLLLATDDYAIVQLNFQRERLVRVPLGGG